MVQAGQSRASCDSVARVALRSAARDHADGSGGVHFKDTILVERGDVHVAGAIHGNTVWVVEVRIESGNAVGPASDRRGDDVLRQRRETHQQRCQQKGKGRSESAHEIFSSKDVVVRLWAGSTCRGSGPFSGPTGGG